MEDFYIGYQAKAPESHKRWGRRFFGILLAGVATLGLLMALGQTGFSSGRYEYGKLTELEGIYREKPLPHIRVHNGKGIYGEHDFRSVLLVGDRKHGAAESIRQAREQHAGMRDSAYAKVRGTLIYNDGKALLELTEKGDAFLEFKDTPPELLVDSSSAAGVIEGFQPYKLETTLQGEIIDPKCYFGAMKPGSGKVHKSCAILCISGGIPPVFKVSTPTSNEYYILLHDNGSPVNEAVLDYVAEPVEIIGHTDGMDDWQILYINPETGIRPL